MSKSDWVLMSTSLALDKKFRGLLPQERHGDNTIRFVLDTILFDSCSEKVRELFVETMKEQLEKANKKVDICA